jgi:60 kDa SS-A/Ro ribonucleoprotein
MSRFNQTRTVEKTYNEAGGRAYKMNDKESLVKILLNSLMQDGFYKSSKEVYNELLELTNKLPEFAAKTALYSRRECGMRTITHIVAGEVVNKVKNEEWTRRFLKNVCIRVDDITEILSYYINVHGKPIPSRLKRGLGDAFQKFDNYQISKYQAKNKKLSLAKAVKLIHVKPRKDMEGTFKSLIEGTLKAKKTFQHSISKNLVGAKTEAEKEAGKAKAWSELIDNRSLGYMALLKNLRNIVESCPDKIDKVIAQLTNRNLIKKSMVFPFRYIKAFEMLDEFKNKINLTKQLRIAELKVALDNAVEMSLDNIPKLEGKTLVAIDRSSSMGNGISEFAGIATLFGIATHKSMGGDVMIFGDTAEYVNVNKTRSLIQNIKTHLKYNSNNWGSTSKHNVGHGTNLSSVFDAIGDTKYDRIFVFSDMQTWQETWCGRGLEKSYKSYKSRLGINPYLYSFDLSSNATTQFSGSKVCQMGGLSDKIFDIIENFEKEPTSLVKKIEQIEL